MKCPGCGIDLEDGALYCKECGEDIHIVPVYDPNVELEMDEALGIISKDVYADSEVKIIITPRRKIWFYNNNIILTVTLSLAGVLLVLLGIGLYFVTNYSTDYLWNRGLKLQTMARYEKAIECYEQLSVLQEDNIDVYFSIAQCYNALGDDLAYEECLVNILSRNVEQDIQKVFSLLVPFYESKGEYGKLSELLENTTFTSVREKYCDYLSMEPEFNFESGFYWEIIPLKFEAESEGTIYFTMDGTTPDTASDVYSTTIFLDEGEHTIKAFYQNKYGVNSDVVTKTYKIILVE